MLSHVGPLWSSPPVLPGLALSASPGLGLARRTVAVPAPTVNPCSQTGSHPCWQGLSAPAAVPKSQSSQGWVGGVFTLGLVRAGGCEGCGPAPVCWDTRESGRGEGRGAPAGSTGVGRVALPGSPSGQSAGHPGCVPSPEPGLFSRTQSSDPSRGPRRLLSSAVGWSP